MAWTRTLKASPFSTASSFGDWHPLENAYVACSTTSEPFHWPDAVLEAIMECDPIALARVLRSLTHAEVNSLLSRSSLDAQTPMFVLGGRLFLRLPGPPRGRVRWA